MAGLTRTDLTTIATRTGKKVVAAWSDHDEGAMGTVYGVVLHHTGSSQKTASRAPTLQIVREGRSDLLNALCTFYIDKDGVIYLVTEKIAWHAGQGAYKGITDGNGHLLGIEAESDGVTWTQATVDSYVALVAEICRYLGADVDTWAIRHATWATPKGRKTDFAGLNEADFKTRVKARIAGTPTKEDELTPDQDKMLRAIYDLLTPGVANVKFDGDVLARIKNVQDIVKAILPGVPGAVWDVQDGGVRMGQLLHDGRDAAVSASQATQVAPAVTVDANAVATALAANGEFVAAIAKAVNDNASARLAS